MAQISETVNDIIMARLVDASICPSHVAEAMNYAISAGGKRIRPTLLYLTYHIFSADGSEESLFRSLRPEEVYMAAIEMIHTHSLIHDDLPALDNDSLRRGRETVHVAYDESTAILAGDALLNYAYEIVCSEIDSIINRQDLSVATSVTLSRRMIRALEVLSRKTGISGMLGGQGLDVQLSGSSITNSDRDYIYKNKTCALIEAPLMIGGILAGLDDSEVSRLEEAGERIGMAFQVQDDILDIYGDMEKLGKEIHQDQRNEKNTYVAEYGLEQSRDYVRQQSEEAITIIDEMADESIYKTELIELIQHMISRDR